MPNKGIIGEIVKVRKNRGEELLVEWRIRDFLSLSTEWSDHYESPKFRFSGERWFMTLEASKNVSVSLYRNDSDEDPTEDFNVRIGIKGPRGLEMEKEVEWFFWDDDGPTGVYVCSTVESWLRSELIGRKSRLMPNGLLSIMCVMRSNVDLAAGGESSQRDSSIETKVISEVKHSSVNRGGEKANEDFAKLLASGENSDVTVHVGEVKFSAHRAILSARSPVLSTMFQHQTAERAANKIVIEDCEPDIFKDFLHYIYVGSVQLLTEHNVFSLYRVADKYLAGDLKFQCLEYLEDTLCVQTFCNTVKIALVHKENDLLERAVDFASENIRLIIRGAEWQNLIREFPDEANEILIQSLGPPIPKMSKT